MLTGLEGGFPLCSCRGQSQDRVRPVGTEGLGSDHLGRSRSSDIPAEVREEGEKPNVGTEGVREAGKEHLLRSASCGAKGRERQRVRLGCLAFTPRAKTSVLVL